MKTDPVVATHLRWLSAVLLVELMFAVLLPSNVLDLIPSLDALSRFLERFAPIVGRFDETAREPQAVRTYLTITFFLIPFKVVYWLFWLHSDYLARYRDLVVSPLTPNRPKKTYGPVGPFVGQAIESKPRSFVSRLIWSALALGLCAMTFFALLYLAGDASLKTGGRSFLFGLLIRLIESAGSQMWLGWSVVYTTFLSAMAAIAICIVRDYAVFAYRELRRVFKKEGSK